MEIDTLTGAFNDFEKKGKKETCPVLDQFLCHIAKTGDTMIQWSQFKSYFLFKLEKVMDDFRASSPEQRGPANPNVEYIPYDEMKERILKIVDGYKGIPFTIQRLCELLTEPKRNYTGTDKFLRGVEKNVMVVSCIYPSSEKNGSSNMSRMNGVMLSGNSSIYTDRNVNGPGSPRILNRPSAKLSLSSPAATNGLPDSTESKDSPTESTEKALSDSSSSSSSSSEADSSHCSPMKNKHMAEDDEDDDSPEAERQEAKRLKFDKDELEDEEEEEEEEEEENGEEDEEEYEEGKFSPDPIGSEDSSSNTPQSSTDVANPSTESKAVEESASDQEPSSTQSEPLESADSKSEGEASPGPADSKESGVKTDQSEEPAPTAGPGVEERPESSGDPVSSSSSSSSSGGEEETSGDSSARADPSSPVEDSVSVSTSVVGSSLDSSETPSEEQMDQD
ncbi:hypothetical protein AALO_G00048890 [Alosa alosa]|uniref:Serine/threonine-protein phosphatase 4 regulatory subunit 2 n=1 Tax=Alosa alosa TaxID=278164 RepID=A0AAV6H367_9TELE|nr:serine/threonine-protein phosphatase 4 regulatory subunit 2-A [Alosa alosa]KAG5281793.1 hypothetical protein AALO_G00048890 [Alosa alosa]